MADGSVGGAHSSPDLVWPRYADEGVFRDGLAKLASGVAIVACQTADGPRGLLVSSLTGLSTDPPRILFCVRRAAAAHADLAQADAISVTLLDGRDRDEADCFAGPGRAVERFSGDRWRLSPRAPPALRDPLAAFSGPVHCRIDAGTHTIFVLDVTRAESRDADPLVYFERGFRALA